MVALARCPLLGMSVKRGSTVLHSHRHKVASQLTLARTNLLTKLLCEHAQIELSRAELSLISSLPNSEPEWGRLQSLDWNSGMERWNGMTFQKI